MGKGRKRIVKLNHARVKPSCLLLGKYAFAYKKKRKEKTGKEKKSGKDTSSKVNIPELDHFATKINASGL